jgi:ribosomal protein L24
MTESNRSNEPRLGDSVRVCLGGDMYRRGVVAQVDRQDQMILVRSEYGRVHNDWVRWSDIC